MDPRKLGMSSVTQRVRSTLFAATVSVMAVAALGVGGCNENEMTKEAAGGNVRSCGNGDADDEERGVPFLVTIQGSWYRISGLDCS